MKKSNYEMNILSLGEIVTGDFRAASVFRKAGLDFCCGGKKSLGEACTEKGIDSSALISELNDLADTPVPPGQNYRDWPPAFLADYIVNTHHRYLQKALPELVFYTSKIATVHGENHPELVTVASLFADINRELLQHLDKEETVLFPAIRRLFENGSNSDAGIIISEITRMTGEHEFAGDAADRINLLTGGYSVPEDGCNTYRVTMKMLDEFEDDLHKHVHLENNILFPAALKASGYEN